MTDLVENDESVKCVTKGTLRGVCFTAHTFTAEHVDKLKSLVSTGVASYVVFQHELCPDTNREHLQGYVEFPNAVRWNKLNTEAGFNAHLEKRLGTPQQAADYCKKLESRKAGTEPFEAGVISVGQGRRSDLAQIQEKLDKRVSVKTIAKENFSTWIKYYKGMDKYRELQTVRREGQQSFCIVLFGESNSGKSRLANELFADSYWISMGNCGVWWDAYEQQEGVVFDEFKGWIKFNDFKRLIDQYPLTVDSKGAQREFNSRYVVFTSNFDPREWYDRPTRADIDAFDRRIHIALEAKRRDSIDGNHDVVCRVLKCVIPWNANMRPGWRLPGLTASESSELINPNVTAERRQEIALRCDIVTKSQSYEVSQSGGVILSPPLNRNASFYDAARRILDVVLFNGATPDATRSAAAPSARDFDAAPDVAPGTTPLPAVPGDRLSALDKKWAASAAARAQVTDDAEPRPEPFLPQVLRDEHGTELRMGKTNYNIDKFLPDKEIITATRTLVRQNAFNLGHVDSTPVDLPASPVRGLGGAAVAAVGAKPPRRPVRHDQVYHPKKFRSNYPRFGVSAYDHSSGSDEDEQPVLRKGKRRAVGSASSADFPHTQLECDSDSVGASMEEHDAGSYQSDSFLEDDMPPARRTYKGRFRGRGRR